MTKSTLLNTFIIAIALIIVAINSGCASTTAPAVPHTVVSITREPIAAPVNPSDPTSWVHYEVRPTEHNAVHVTPVARMQPNTLCSGATENGGTHCVQAPRYDFVAAR